ncbi:MAG: SWF/SNF helicase family protein, partial [Pirellulaceae bacterium]|nr:SWF/SNF helicase family protein [Pirellulaceae bacterium]
EIVDRFQSSLLPFDLLVLSPKAAGIGLTITAANHVIHLSRWWNPAVEDQAVNRAHRIGVSAPVTVTRMMASGTIEQRIHEVLEEKRELFNQLFAEAGTPRTVGLSQQEIFGLFKLKVPPAQKKAA